MEQNLIIFDEEDIKEGLQECQNSIIGKLVTEKAVHANSLMNALNNIWNSPKGFKVVDLGDKRFQFFFDSGKDANRVIRGVCMGTVMEADVFEIQGRGSYIRVLIEIEVSKPLLPGISASSRKDGIFWADFKFERVPQFCYKCGIIGHDEDGCNSTTQENTDEMSRGLWMRATHVGRPVKAENPHNHHHKPPTNPNQEEKRRKQTQDLLEELSGLTVQSTLQDAPKNVDSTLPNPPSSSLSTNEKPSDAATLKLQETNRMGRKDAKEKENVPMAVGGMKRGPDTFPDETMADTEDPRSLKKLHLSIPPAGLEVLKRVHRDVGEVPWLCFGDMNQVMSNDEKRGGNLIPESILRGFGECVQLFGLIDLGYVGPKFTWDNRQKEELNIKARLDRFLACSRWQDMFPSSVVYHLGHCPSDHCPILLDTNNRPGGRRGKPNVLRFEKIWADDIECEQVLLEGWSKGGGELHSNMTSCLQVLESWGSRKFGDIPKRIRKSQKNWSI
ncbi:Zinc knuckle CX2CX4HX4C [Sesbania bispinosa]|nr:Zinc knuckle CX2CX4HX4C [Sesbania bispinosa]